VTGAPPPVRTQVVGAAISITIGLTAVILIYLHPENLRAPAWVAYAAGCAFVLAGLCILAGAFEMVWLWRWLAIAAAVSLLAISVWVAFGAGARECSVSPAFLRRLAPQLVCRGAFGVGAALVALFIVVAIRRAVRARSGDHGNRRRLG
jgi:hypothetical protein